MVLRFGWIYLAFARDYVGIGEFVGYGYFDGLDWVGELVRFGDSVGLDIFLGWITEIWLGHKHCLLGDLAGLDMGLMFDCVGDLVKLDWDGNMVYLEIMF